MTRRGLLLLLALLTVGAVLGWRTSDAPVLSVRPGTDVARVITRAPTGATIRLLAGDHHAFEVPRPVSIEAEPGAVVHGEVRITGDSVALRDLRIVGGENGVTVHRADHAQLEGLTITGAELHGIEVVSGSALVSGCVIRDLQSTYAQGFEIRNSNGHPRTVVEGCIVEGGQEGILSHVSRVEFRDNVVRGTTLRGIAVTEMSEGIVEGNLVENAVGIAYYCGDMSHCDITANISRGTVPDPENVRSRRGYGAVAYYYSTMRVRDNRFVDAPAGPIGVFSGSILTDRFPLSIWAPGWRGALPGIAWAAGAILLVALVRLAVGPWARRERRPGGPRDRGLALNVLLVGFAVQSFHMLEHGVQVFQVYVAAAESRSGIAGSIADAEWVHFTYNAAVLLFLMWAWRAIRPGGVLERLGAGTAPWFFAALVIQTYHFAEHTAKIVQHIRFGIDPAPGIVGGPAGLVWFHFGINLSVYVGMAIPLAAVIGRVLRSRASRPRVAAAPVVAAQPEPPISS